MSINATAGEASYAEDIPLDVFDLADSGLVLESLTAGHGLSENGASEQVGWCSSCSCAGCGGNEHMGIPTGGPRPTTTPKA